VSLPLGDAELACLAASPVLFSSKEREKHVLDTLRERIGQFEFSLAVCEPGRTEDRVTALLAWLLARWERQ